MPSNICPNGGHCAEGKHTFVVARDRDGRKEGVGCEDCDVSLDDRRREVCLATGRAPIYPVFVSDTEAV